MPPDHLCFKSVTRVSSTLPQEVSTVGLLIFQLKKKSRLLCHL